MSKIIVKIYNNSLLQVDWSRRVGSSSSSQILGSPRLDLG